MDFREYWSAYKLFLAEKNAYSYELMQSFQQSELGYAEPMMMWNPPWLVLWMAPILNLNYQASAILWQVTSVIIYTTCCWAFIGSLNASKSKLLKHAIILAALFFLPFINCIELGQIGCLLLLGAILIYFGLLKHSKILFMLGLMIVSCKPHLFFLAFIPVGWSLLKDKRYSFLVVGILGLTIQIIFCELVFPNSLEYWLNSLMHPPTDSFPRVQNWVTATLLGGLRFYLFPSSWNSFAIVMMSWFCFAIGILFYLINKRPHLNWNQVFPWLLAFSTVLAPFGWLFDHVLLAPLYLIALIQGVKNFPKNAIYLVLIIIVQPLAYLLMKNYYQYNHEIFWFGPLLICLASLIYKPRLYT